jgi:3-oxoacyl-[acyl-carrier protein] reductase
MKWAVVTGSSRGVGLAVSLALVERGYGVCALGRKSEAQLEAVRRLSEKTEHSSYVVCDLAEERSIEAAAAEVLELHGAPALVVHCAGIVERQTVGAMSDESWRRQLEVNLDAPFRLTSALLPAMLAQRQGRILFVSSISASLGSKQQAAYNASKAGLVALMRCLAEELSDTGLMTAAVLPGAIATDMLKGSGYEPRMSADDVARTICFLGTEASLAHNGGITEMFGV